MLCCEHLGLGLGGAGLKERSAIWSATFHATPSKMDRASDGGIAGDVRYDRNGDGSKNKRRAPVCSPPRAPRPRLMHGRGAVVATCGVALLVTA
jgi:hypothetical protein